MKKLTIGHAILSLQIFLLKWEFHLDIMVAIPGQLKARLLANQINRQHTGSTGDSDLGCNCGHELQYIVYVCMCMPGPKQVAPP